jgi:Ca2+/Na+ antiporter
MTLGAAAVVRPLRIDDPDLLRLPMAAMVLALVAVVALGARRRSLGRRDGTALLLGYPAFVALALLG